MAFSTAALRSMRTACGVGEYDSDAIASIITMKSESNATALRAVNRGIIVGGGERTFKLKHITHGSFISYYLSFSNLYLS